MPKAPDKLAGPEDREQRNDAPGQLLLIGGMTTVLLFASLSYWAATSEVASAAIATGTVTVEGNRKAIQHREGGSVETVYVREADRVTAGQPLLKLDLSDEVANADVLEGLLLQHLARRARLEAEADDADKLQFPDELFLEGSKSARSMLFMQQETDLFVARREAYLGERTLLQQQIAGAKQQIAALEGSLRATNQQLALIREEKVSLQPLVEKGLITRPRVLALARAEAELGAELERINATLADLASRIEEAEIRTAQLTRERHEMASDELATVEARLSEVRPQLSATRRRLERGTLIAPEDGYVFELGVHGPGAAIVPGQTVMEIVPADDALVLSLQIKPTNIDEVHPGQTVLIQLLAFQHQYELELTGTLKSVSSDEVYDPQAQMRYFRGVVEFDNEQLRESGKKIVPGMPAQAVIETGSRTIMSYLFEPIRSIYRYSLREQ